MGKATFRTHTIDTIAGALTPAIWLTAAEIQTCLPEWFAVVTIRNVMLILVQQGRAELERGPDHKRRYRRPGTPP